MRRRGRRLPPLLAAVFVACVAARPAAAQQEPWAPAPPTVAQPAPPEGGGVGLQLLAAVGIGGAAIGAMALSHPNSDTGKVVTWGLVGVTPAAVGLAVCNLGVRSERREPSCPRAVIAAYIGSLIAIPVLLVTFLMNVDWGPGPNPHETRAEVIVFASTGTAWVGGMTLGATVFGRRRIRPPAYAPAPPPQPAVFVPSDDPRQPRWAGARSSSGALLFRLLSVDF